MPTLYIVNHPEALASCLEIAATDDSVLLIEDGVHQATEDQPRDIIALQEDIASRNLNTLGRNVSTTD